MASDLAHRFNHEKLPPNGTIPLTYKQPPFLPSYSKQIAALQDAIAFKLHAPFENSYSFVWILVKGLISNNFDFFFLSKKIGFDFFSLL